jgi:hypothetical protein
MKVYTGWIVSVNNKELEIIGTRKLRAKQYYILKDTNNKKLSIERHEFLEQYNNGTIKYIR